MTRIALKIAPSAPHANGRSVRRQAGAGGPGWPHFRRVGRFPAEGGGLGPRGRAGLYACRTVQGRLSLVPGARVEE